jgi:hypothetical protein
LDFALISKHENNTTKHSVKYELDCAKVFLKGLREMFPKALIIYKYGNHDLRFDKWIRLKAPVGYREHYAIRTAIIEGFRHHSA